MRGRPIESDDYVLMGMMAEYCFVIEARKAGVACPGMVLERRFYFDGDVDFTINGNRIAVEASRRAMHLYVAAGSMHADVYVLAHYFSERRVGPLGWTTAADLCALTPDESPAGVLSHAMPVEDLRPMVDLWALLRDTDIATGAARA